jgi:hypothetical protein
VPPPLTWQISQTIVDCLSLTVFACVLNQSHGHWLLNDVLHSTISMSLKLREENQVLPSFESIMDVAKVHSSAEIQKNKPSL